MPYFLGGGGGGGNPDAIDEVFLHFGATTTGTAGTRYLNAWTGSLAQSTTPRGEEVPFDGMIDSFVISEETPHQTNDLTYRILLDGVPVATLVNPTLGARQEATGLAIAVTKHQLVRIEVTGTIGVAASNPRARVGIKKG